MAIKAKPNETVDSMLRRFKRETLKSGILQDLRKHEFFMSPSEKRRKKQKDARRMLQRKQEKFNNQ